MSVRMSTRSSCVCSSHYVLVELVTAIEIEAGFEINSGPGPHFSVLTYIQEREC